MKRIIKPIVAPKVPHFFEKVSLKHYFFLFKSMRVLAFGISKITQMKTAVLLSGCGVYDGSEIHESVLALLALAQNKLDYICTAPNINQHHVLNHTTGEVINETRNVMVESARIARGEIVALKELDKDSISSLVLPGGWRRQNLSNWAFEGPKGTVVQEVKDLILYQLN